MFDASKTSHLTVRIAGIFIGHNVTIHPVINNIVTSIPTLVSSQVTTSLDVTVNLQVTQFHYYHNLKTPRSLNKLKSLRLHRATPEKLTQS